MYRKDAELLIATRLKVVSGIARSHEDLVELLIKDCPRCNQYLDLMAVTEKAKHIQSSLLIGVVNTSTTPVVIYCPCCDLVIDIKTILIEYEEDRGNGRVDGSRWLATKGKDGYLGE